MEAHFADKGSYTLDTMLATIATLPHVNTNIFSPKYQIYCLDDYSVHITDEVREALLKRGYILVCLEGGITGDVQVNDTHLHHPLKQEYRKSENQLMMDQLRANPEKIPAPTRDDMMSMLVNAFDSATQKLDMQLALKQNFIFERT